jgi:hypothetical protein
MTTLDPKEKVLAAVAEALLPAFNKEADAAAKKGDDGLARTLRLRGDFSPHVVKEVRWKTRKKKVITESVVILGVKGEAWLGAVAFFHQQLSRAKTVGVVRFQVVLYTLVFIRKF